MSRSRQPNEVGRVVEQVRRLAVRRLVGARQADGVADPPFAEEHDQGGHEADEKDDAYLRHVGHATKQAVPRQLPGALVEIAVRSTQGVEAVAPLGADRRDHERPTDQADEHHRHDDAEDNDEGPQKPGDEFAEVGNAGYPTEWDQDENEDNAQEHQGKDRGREVGEEAFLREQNRLLEADPFMAGELHRS